MAEVNAHTEHGVFFNHDTFDHLRARADKAVVFNDGGARLHRLQHAANAYAARQMHMLADLCARAYCGPGVHHRALIHIGTNVHVAGHQDRALGDVAAAPRHRGRHHAHTGFAHLLFTQVGELGGHLVIKTQAAGFHYFIVFQAKAQQHGFLEPLVDCPLAYALARGHTQAAFVEFADHVIDSIRDFFRCRFGVQVGSVFPRGVDDGFELLGHGCFVGVVRW